MDKISDALDSYQSTLCKQLPLGGLYARNNTAYKWKAPYRAAVLRECVSWRFVDLLKQAHSLYNTENTLGSRILVRSAMETLALLIYQNQQIERVISNDLNFHSFCATTIRLILGSRNGTTEHESIHILKVLRKCDKKYPSLMHLYETLSESAHPNYEGMLSGYSHLEYDDYETHFVNNWSSLYSRDHEQMMLLLMAIFEEEYNNVWSRSIDAFETWIEENNSHIEATRADHPE